MQYVPVHWSSVYNLSLPECDLTFIWDKYSLGFTVLQLPASVFVRQPMCKERADGLAALPGVSARGEVVG